MELSGQQWDELYFNYELSCPHRLPKICGLVIYREKEVQVPTRVNLSRRGCLLDSHLLSLVMLAMEDVQHVFFRCDLARFVLRKIVVGGIWIA
ncbi:hypothetical protein Tco_0980401 [Tanacetum coccineum]